jgi:hypothetical protein
MLSDKQLEANRANAQKSTGPRTEDGKKRSSLNAVRHGLTGHVVVLPEEEMEVFHQFTDKIMADLKAEGDHEFELAKTYSTAMWNLQKAMAVQDTLFTLGLMENVGENLNIENPDAHNAVSYAKTYRQESEAFNRISLYVQRLVNQSKSLLKLFEDVQARRRATHKAEMVEAVQCYKFKQMMGETFDPAQNGFVCSLDEIRLRDRRWELTIDADLAHRCDWNRETYEKAVAAPAA